MDLFPTDEQALLTETARSFVARAADPQSVRALEDGEMGFDPAQWAAMVELGWTELEPLELALVADELGRGAVPSPLLVGAALRNALPDFARTTSAEMVLTLADVAADGTATSASPSTRSYVLVPYASHAHRVVVMTASGLMVLDPTVANWSIEREEVIGGDPMFRLDGDLAAAERIPGSLDSVLDHVGITALAYATGAAETALNLSVQHAKDRQQFGRPVGSFQAVAHRCADMRAEIDACRVLGQRAAWALARDGDATFEVSAALGYAKDALRRVAMHAHQVHGAIGFSTEHDLHLYTRRIKAFELSYGSTAWHQERFAQALGLRA